VSADNRLPYDDFNLAFQDFAEANPDLDFSALALAFAAEPRTRATQRAWDDTGRALNVFTTNRGAYGIEYNASFSTCPKTPMLAGQTVDDVYVYDNVVYPVGSDDLCGLCRHQLCCALGDHHKNLSFEAAA
jgi:hypothetical protein